MAKYDFFIAGRWRNKQNIQNVLDAVRDAGKSAFCFIENDYKGELVEFSKDADPNTFMAKFERLPQSHPLVRKIFEKDMAAQRASDIFILVLPAGKAGHMEAGAAYGMGKRCYAVGTVEQTESLYCIFDQIFPDLESLKTWLLKPKDN